MCSKFLLSTVILVPLALIGVSASASAEDMWNPNSSYNPKYDIKIYPKAPVHHAMTPAHTSKLSCAAAERIVRDDGFHHVQARDCGGKTYVFKAERHGRPVLVDVNARNGRSWIA